MQEEGDGAVDGEGGIDWFDDSDYFDFGGFLDGQLDKWLGHPYLFDGDGYDGRGIDCSNWVHRIYSEQGLNYSYEWTGEMRVSGTWAPITRAPMAGDIVLYEGGHVGIYYGNGYVVSALGHNSVGEVKVHPLNHGPGGWSYWEWAGEGESDS